MSPAELRALTPDFSWESYFRDIGFPDIREVNVGQPEFFQALDKQLTSVPLADWKTYLRWHVIHAVRAGAFLEVRRTRISISTAARSPAPRNCSRAGGAASGSTDRNLGEALGQKYVAQAFPPEAKEQARQMVQNLVAGAARRYRHAALDERPRRASKPSPSSPP